MIEFLIRRTDGEWFDLPAGRMADVLRPSSVPSRLVQGNGEHCMEVLGCLIECSYEDPGIQVSFTDNTLSQKEASQIVEEIAERITESTGQKSRVVPL